MLAHCWAQCANTARTVCAALLEAAVNQQRIGVLELSTSQPALVNQIAVPDALASYVVEAGRASDYDHLLLANGDAHE